MNSPLFHSPATYAQFFWTQLESKSPIFRVNRPSSPAPLPSPVNVVELKMPKRQRDNSLKHICHRIMAQYYDQIDVEIQLNDFSQQMGVERRRIYDIVNILEGFDVFVKRAKNVYTWKGIGVFMLKLRVLESLDASEHKDLKLFKFEKSPLSSKKKSLTYLAIRFLRSFCVRNDSISFKAAVKSFADELNGVNADQNIKDDDKNMVRRLYDIINVFKALGLISKIPTQEGKSDFCWRGSKGIGLQLQELNNTEDTAPKEVFLAVEKENTGIFSTITGSDNQIPERPILKTSGFSLVKGCHDFDPGKLKRPFLNEEKENLF